MSATARTEIVVNEHKAACPVCGHTEYGDSDLEALKKLGPHVQANHPRETASAVRAEGNVVPLKKRD